MSDIDVKYLRDKGIPLLLESIAAELVTRKPSNPEAFLKEKFALGENALKRGENVKIYAKTLDPFCAVVLLAAGYAGANVEFVEVDADRGMMPADFANVSPFLRVPIVEHAGVTISECGPACRYLCNGSPALPLASRERGKIEAAFELVHNVLLPQAAEAVREKVFSPQSNKRPVDQVSVTAAVDRFSQILASINDRCFKDGIWVVGKDMSVADMALAAAIFSVQNVVGMECLSDRVASVKVWHDTIQKEEFYRESLKAFSAAALRVHSGN